MKNYSYKCNKVLIIRLLSSILIQNQLSLDWVDINIITTSDIISSIFKALLFSN